MTSAIAWMIAQPLTVAVVPERSSQRRGRKRGLPRADYEVIELLLLFPRKLTAVEIAAMIDVPVKQVYRCRERMRRGTPIVLPDEPKASTTVSNRPYDRCTQLRKVISEGATISQAARILGVTVPFARRVLHERLNTTVAELQQTRQSLITLVRQDKLTIKAACQKLKISIWRGRRLLAANYDRK